MANLTELTFILWNATSINNKEDEFNYFINNNKVDIALITETWLNPNFKIKFTNYETIRCDSPRIVAGGVAIIINSRINYHILPQVDVTGCDILLIKIQSGLNLTVGVVYAPPSVTFDFNCLNNIIKDHSPIFIGGDFNAKHRTWNNFTNNARGIQLNNYILKNDISLIHSDTYTHKAPHKNASNIDIFITKDIPYNCTCYSTNDLSSNHLLVTLKFDRVNLIKKELILNKTDWTAYFDRTDKWRIDYNLNNINSIDQCIEKIQKYILRAFRQSSTYQQRKRHTLVTDEGDRAALDHLIKLRNYYRRKFQRSGLTKYKLYRNILNNHIKKALQDSRNKYWQNKLKILNIKDKSLWHTLKTLQHKRIPPPLLTLSDQTIIYDPTQKAEEIAKNFFSVYQNAAKLTSPLSPVVNDYITQLDKMTPPLNINYLIPYTLLNIIKKMPNNKTLGQDRITYIMLKNCSFKIILQIYYIVKESMQLSYFPRVWKTALVLAFPKPGKALTSPANYRPISLLSGISKIYKKIIRALIMKSLESESIIINEQFGFRPRHSTIAQLLRLTENFAMEINKKRNSAMILLDLQKAFDSVWHRGLLYKLHLNKIPDYIIKIIRSYLRDRKFIVSFNEAKSTSYNANAGVPQGSVLGPVLFNIYINDIPKSRETGLAIYVDTAIYSSSWSTALLAYRLQTHVDDILQYFVDWKMSINPDKTEAIVFTRRRQRLPPFIRIIDYKVPWSSRVKYLGVLDSSLTWGPAITDRINKTNATFRILYPLINRKSTLHIKFKLLLYKICARPALLYAATVWAAAPRTHLNRLQITQNKFLRIIFNASRYTPVEELHKSAEIETIDEVIARMISNVYNHDHDNPVIRNTGNYNIHDLPFRIRCRLPKHFIPINTYR